MEHGGKANDRRAFFHELSHFTLALISISDDLGKRPIVADGAREDKRDVIFDRTVHNAVVNLVVVDKLRNRAAGAHFVDYVQMVVVSVRVRFLRVDILPERGVQQRALEIVRRERVSGQQTVRIAVFDQFLHCPARVIVERERRPHDPQNVPVLLFIAQKLHEMVVISCIRRFAAPALPEDELIIVRIFRSFKALSVKVNPICALFRPAQNHAVALLEVAVFHNVEPSVFPPDDACVHAALSGQAPYALQLKILRVHGCAVEALGGHTILRSIRPFCVRRVFESQRVKIRRKVGGKRKSHRKLLSRALTLMLRT